MTHAEQGTPSERLQFISIGLSDSLTRPLKTAETVARDVVHSIVVAGLQPGDNLPPEAAMLEQYGVSRESLREALRLLEVQGLISIRRGPGGGPIVGMVDPSNLGRISTLYFHLAGATYKELFEAWAIAEVILAERAARHPDVARRREVMGGYMSDHIPPDPKEFATFVETHTRFHAAIASLADNRVLELSLQTPGLIVGHHFVLTGDPFEVGEVIVDDHRDLARAIVAGNHRQAHDLMEEHIAGMVTHQHLGDAGIDAIIEWH